MAFAVEFAIAKSDIEEAAVRYGEGYGEGYGARCRRIREALEQGSKKGFRRYELRKIDGRLMLVRNEIDRFFGIAVSEVFGTELEPDDKDGMFLDKGITRNQALKCPKRDWTAPKNLPP